jgi:hypothetical protein
VVQVSAVSIVIVDEGETTMLVPRVLGQFVSFSLEQLLHGYSAA